MSTGSKNPVFVESGLRGARARWGDHEPKTVRLTALDPHVREVVLTLIRADEAARRVDEKAAPNADGTAMEVSSASSNTAAS